MSQKIEKRLNLTVLIETNSMTDVKGRNKYLPDTGLGERKVDVLHYVRKYLITFLHIKLIINLILRH